jgi:hypothetical protein
MRESRPQPAALLDPMLSTSTESKAYPQVGSRWKDLDRRVKRTIQVVRLDTAKKRVRIHCIETDVLSWAKPERFGKSGGYIRL